MGIPEHKMSSGMSILEYIKHASETSVGYIYESAKFKSLEPITINL